jgi:ubiquinone/menaquinone biosynthesis C-methylase UbiE
MTEDAIQEYDDDLTAVLEAVWGEGFMSPGGTDEVDGILAGLELRERSVLDIGCGLGGMDIHIANTYPVASVTGIDIEADLIEKCQRMARLSGVTDKVTFQQVEPGPFPFDDGCFDLVTSKDAIIHIADKSTLARDIHRVLAPGGIFAASDWLAGYEGEPSPEMKAYVVAEGLDFGLATAETYRQALIDAGFQNVQMQDRNAWYRATARRERDALSGPLYDSLTSAVGIEFVAHQIEVWDLMIVALDQGQLRPTHLRAEKPA